MNNILKLKDSEYVKNFFKENILPEYGECYNIKAISIVPHKDLIWESTYHVVIEYQVSLVSEDESIKELVIFCTAHSSEQRQNVYNVLNFLWEHGFADNRLTIPRPLYYSKEFNGTFYEGVVGRNLYQYIRESKLKQIEEVVPKAAQWFLKLHRVKSERVDNFNTKNSRIKTTIPGVEHILERVSHDYGDYKALYEKAYSVFITGEEDFLNSTNERWLVHGDAHPENIIKMKAGVISGIDFTDMCLTDFARDIGSFKQQLNFMIMRKIGDAGYAKKIVDLFLDNYFKSAKIELDTKLKKRIDMYYYWTMMRTATHFLMKDKAEPERAKPLIENIKKYIENF